MHGGRKQTTFIPYFVQVSFTDKLWMIFFSQYFSNSKLRKYKCKMNTFICTQWPEFILGRNHLLNWSETRHLLWNFNHTCLLKLESQSLGISFSYAWILFSPQIQPKQCNSGSDAATTQLFWKMGNILEECLTSRYLVTVSVSPDSCISTLSQFSFKQARNWDALFLFFNKLTLPEISVST